jgi:hypothetical protein
MFSPSKEALIWPSSVAPEPERESRSHAQAQLDDPGVDGVLRVLGGCALRGSRRRVSGRLFRRGTHVRGRAFR